MVRVFGANNHRGFTLVELLVVVTIIVILLALLVPAMDKAIYQASLVECGGRLKVAGAAVIHYTFDNKRWYPDRGLIGKKPDENPVAWLSAMALVQPQDGYDMRPPLRPIMDISKTLQCPFAYQLDLVNTDPDVGVEASYVMFWGWRYEVPQRTRASANQNTGEVNVRTTGARSGEGMYRIGDKFTLDGDAFGVLAGDIDLKYPDSSQASHLDRDRLMSLIVAEDDVIFYTRARVSRWRRAIPEAGDRNRGDVDNNFVFDDGSVQRYTDVPDMIRRSWTNRDKRFAWVPIQWDQRRQGDDLQIPLR